MQLIEKIKNWLGHDHNALKVGVLTMIAIGTIFIYLVGPFGSARILQEPNFFFNRYIPFMILGIGFLGVGSMLSKKWILRISRIWLVIGCGLILVSVLNPHIVRGAARYVSLFGLVLDPYALTLPAYIVMMSYWLGQERTRKSQRAWACAWITALTIAIIFLAFRAPYVMMGLIYLAVFVIMACRVRKNMPALSKISIITALATAAIILLAFFTMPHVHQRLGAIVMNNNYPTSISIRAINSSSLIGTNPDALKILQSVPSSVSDYALTGVIARFGICAAALLLALYYWVARQLRRNGRATQDTFYALLNTGTLVMFSAYLFFSLTTVLGILPTASYLPLVSYSPSCMMAFCVLFGFIFSERKSQTNG